MQQAAKHGLEAEQWEALLQACEQVTLANQRADGTRAPRQRSRVGIPGVWILVRHHLGTSSACMLAPLVLACDQAIKKVQRA